MAYPTLSNLSTQFDCARLGWTTPIPQAGRRYSTDSEPLEHVKSSLCCFKSYHISFLFDLMLRSFVSLHITLWSCLMPHHIIVPIVSYYLALPEVLRLLRQTEKHFQSRPSQGHWTRRHKLLCLPHKIISEARALYVRVCSFHKPRSVKETTLYIYIYTVFDYCLKVETSRWGALPNCNGCHLPLLSNSCIFSCLFLLVIDPEGVLRQLKFLEQLW